MLLPYVVARAHTLVSSSLMVSGRAPLMSMGLPHMVHAFILPNLSAIA